MGSWVQTVSVKGTAAAMYYQVLVYICIYKLCYCNATLACEDDIQAVVSSNYTYTTCTDIHIKQSIQTNIHCSPTTVTIQLPWPNYTAIHQMTPTHIAVQRCEGSCHQSGHGCVALQTHSTRIPVMFGKCGLNVGLCSKQCAHVTVLEHTRCGCACELRRSDCDSTTHLLRQETCTCECRDTRARRQCVDQGRTWSGDSCECTGCPTSRISDCPTGFTYDYNDACECVKMDAATEELIVTKLEEEVETDIATVISWELVIIISLVLILFLLVMTMLILMMKMKKLRRKMNSTAYLVPSTLSSQYYPCSDPCSDLSPHKIHSVSDSDSDRGRDTVTDSSLCSEERSHCNYQEESYSRESLGIKPDLLNGNIGIMNRVTLPSDMPSNYNTVKIVYRNGERTMELNCQVEQSNSDKLNITENPLVYRM